MREILIKFSNHLITDLFMKKTNLFFATLAAAAFVACSDDFANAPPVVNPNPDAREIPIVFNSSSSNLTRADFTDAVAADMLGGKFVVTGYKGPKTEWKDNDNNIVFDNFIVEWGENTANTTESNAKNWEYVGKVPSSMLLIKASPVRPSSTGTTPLISTTSSPGQRVRRPLSSQVRLRIQYLQEAYMFLPLPLPPLPVPMVLPTRSPVQLKTSRSVTSPTS